MNKNLIIPALILSTCLLSSCERDEMVYPQKESNTNIIISKDFVLERTEVNVKKGESTSINIISGNATYTTNQSANSRSFAIVNVSQDKKSLIINGVQEGSVRTTITDVVAKKTIEIVINITK